MVVHPFAFCDHKLWNHPKTTPFHAESDAATVKEHNKIKRLQGKAPTKRKTHGKTRGGRGPLGGMALRVYVQAHRSEIWNGLYALDVHREVHICVLLLSRIVTECNIK
mgnify:CR=1 FL=1